MAKRMWPDQYEPTATVNIAITHITSKLKSKFKLYGANKRPETGFPIVCKLKEKLLLNT